MKKSTGVVGSLGYLGFLAMSSTAQAQSLPPLDVYGGHVVITESSLYGSEVTGLFKAVWDANMHGSITAVTPGALITMDSAIAGATFLRATYSAVITLNNANITSRGSDQVIVYIDRPGTISLSNATVQINGAGSKFISSFPLGDSDPLFNIENVQVTGGTFLGANLISDNIALNANNLSLNYTAVNNDTVFNIAANNLDMNLNNTRATNQGAAVFNVTGSVKQVNVNNSSFTSNGADSVGILVGNGVTFAPTFTNSTMQVNKAVWQVDGGATLNLTANRSSFTGMALRNDGASQLNATLNDGSSWTVTGNSNVNNLISNNSVVQFSAPNGAATAAASYKTLTISDSYASNGGVIGLNTHLGGDGSPTDVVVLDGATISGQTGLRVTNWGGQGDATGVGIRVVQALNGATTTEDSFYLDRSSPNYRPSTGTLSVYGFEYSLVRGGDGGGADDWYLDSFVDNPMPGPGPAPGPRPNPGGMINLSPELGAYVGNQVAAVKMFALSRDDRDLSRVPLTGDHSRGFWMRVQGGRDQNMKMETGRVTMSTNTYVVQLGGDVWSRQSGEQGRLVAGLMAGYGEARTNAQSQVFVRAANRSLRAVDLNADGTSKGYSVGGYFTWLSNEVTRLGTYVDSWVQYGHYDNSLSGELGNSSYNSQLWSASVESGYAFKPFASARLVVEPQAQLIYSHYSADSMNMTNVPVKSMDYNEVDTRVGVRLYPLGKTMESSSIRPFAEVNWLYRSGTPKAEVGPYSFSIVPLRNAAQLKLGVEGKIGKSLYLTGQIMGYTGSDSLRGYGGMVNASYRW